MAVITLAIENQEGVNSLLDKIAANTPRYMTKKEVAEAFKVSNATVNRWIRSGEMKFASIGGILRISTKDVEAFYNRNRDMELLPKELKKVAP